MTVSDYDVTKRKENAKRVLVIGSHIGSNLELFVKRGLESWGCEVEFVGYQQHKKLPSFVRMVSTRSYYIRSVFAKRIANRYLEEITLQVQRFKPDILLAIKGEMLDGKSIGHLSKEYGIKTALWFPDDPRYFDSLVRHVAPFYDHIFTKSERMVPRYKEIGVDKVHELAFGCDPNTYYFEPALKKSINASFIGTYDRRRSKLLRSLNRKDLHIYGPYWRLFHRKDSVHNAIWGDEVRHTINKSKVVLNIHAQSDLDLAPNMRAFEIPGCHALMLTDRPNGIEKYYEIGKEMVCYDGPRDLASLIDYYSEADEEREKISAQGYEKTVSQHTYKHRMKQFLDLVH